MPHPNEKPGFDFRFQREFFRLVQRILTALGVLSIAGALLVASGSNLSAWIAGTLTVWALAMGVHYGLDTLVRPGIAEPDALDRSGFA